MRRACFWTALAVGALAPAAPAQTVSAPRSGSVYQGSPGKVQLAVSGRSLGLAAFSFTCSSTRGRTSLNSIALQRTSRGYRFEFRGRGGITFADGRADENGSIRFAGRFSRTARSVRGTSRVTSRHCRAGEVEWTARLAGG
jgi:hypothetical protein